MPIKFNKKENLEPPLGISYIGAVLREAGHEVFLKDFEVEFFSKDAICKFIKEKDIEIAGVSFRTASYGSAKIFIKTLRDFKKDLIIMVGGHHATAFSKATISDMSCDIVVRGEGEYVVAEIADAIINKRPFENIKGITYLKDGKILFNEDRAQIIDLDSIPFPARDMLPYQCYTLATIITSRGCSFGCIYCDKGISTKKVQYRSPDNILKEIACITKVFKKHRLYIVDDNFFLKKERTNAILDGIISSGLDIKWVCQARVDGVDKDMLSKAKKSGCEQIIFGLETGDEKELFYIKKQTTLSQARRAIRLTKLAGIKARANFMLGFPISTHETIKNTIRFAKEIEPDIVKFFVVTPLPNTELWNNIYRSKDVTASIDWSNFDFYNPNFETEGLKRRDITLYIIAGYWHVLKKKFLFESTIFLIPNLGRLFLKSMRTGKLRGSISQYFPASVSLIQDVLPQIFKNNIFNAFRLFADALKLEKGI